MPAKDQSKKQYLAKRKAKVRELYIHERLEPRDIAARLVKSGTIETTDESLESAIRLVRADVADVRAEIDSRRTADADASVAFNETDALEYELADLRKERDRQKMIADGEPDTEGKEAVYIVTMMGAGGEPVQFEKPKWPAGVRQKAGKDASVLAEKISKLEVVIAGKRRAPNDRDPDAPKVAESFAFVFPNVKGAPKELDSLIAMNLDKGRIN